MYKIGKTINEITTEHTWKNEYAFQRTTGPDRLIITAEKNQTRLIYNLITAAADKFDLLYILLISRTGNKPGRYQSPEPLSKNELREFLNKYENYLETDGRHHLWISSAETDDLIVYDHHNVLYAYGPVKTYSDILDQNSFKKTDTILFPVPHTHQYNRENDEEENDMIHNNEWRYFELEAGDDY